MARVLISAAFLIGPLEIFECIRQDVDRRRDERLAGFGGGLCWIAENRRMAGFRPRTAHIGARRIGGSDQIPADGPVFCSGKLDHFHEMWTRRQLKRGLELATVTHSACDRFAHGVNAICRRLPITNRRNNEVKTAVKLVNQVPRHRVVGGTVRAIAVQDDEVMKTLSDERGADLEHHGLIRRNGKRDRAWKEFEGLGYTVGDRRRDYGVDPRGQLERNMFDLMSVGVSRHVRTVRFGGSGREYHWLSRLNKLRDLHLGHVRHATFHFSLRLVAPRRSELP